MEKDIKYIDKMHTLFQTRASTFSPGNISLSGLLLSLSITTANLKFSKFKSKYKEK